MPACASGFGRQLVACEALCGQYADDNEGKAVRQRNLIVILTWLLLTAGQAADITDRFSIRGAGLLTCDIYVSERAERSEAYLMIGGWLDGYITGVNQYAPDTYDVTSFESTELLSIIIDNHCQQNPEDRLFSVVNSILAELHDD